MCDVGSSVAMTAMMHIDASIMISYHIVLPNRATSAAFPSLPSLGPPDSLEAAEKTRKPSDLGDHRPDGGGGQPGAWS